MFSLTLSVEAAEVLLNLISKLLVYCLFVICAGSVDVRDLSFEVVKGLDGELERGERIVWEWK
jgi:hypothetical protein